MKSSGTPSSFIKNNTNFSSAKSTGQSARSSAQQPTAGQPDRDAIERRAYALWESSGRVSGREQDHWFQAEQELVRGTPEQAITRRSSGETDNPSPYAADYDRESQARGN